MNHFANVVRWNVHVSRGFMTFSNVLLDFATFVLAWVNVLIAPYTKVEESFNLHATHDIIFYGVGSSAVGQYDHVIFPGAVPRTFIGSLLLAFASKPLIALASLGGFSLRKSDIQVLGEAT